MKAFSYISKSIGLMQAALLLVSAVLIGLGLSAWEMRSALADQRSAITSHAQRLLDLSLSGAASAAWELDVTLAVEIAEGIARQEGVAAVDIHAYFGKGERKLLARRENSPIPAGAAADWLAQKYFTDVSSAGRELSVSQQNRRIEVGDIAIEIAPTYGAQKLLAVMNSILTVTLLEAVLTGAVLLLMVQWLVTAPLRRAAAKISRLDPDALEDTEFSIEIPKLHQSDELGLLFGHTNQLLDRLVESQSALQTLATR